MDEKKVLIELIKTKNVISDISKKLGDKRELEKFCPDTLIDEVLCIISDINEYLKFIYEQVNRLNKEE